eukprot:1141250-Amphidinium_carterae.1
MSRTHRRDNVHKIGLGQKAEQNGEEIVLYAREQGHLVVTSVSVTDDIPKEVACLLPLPMSCASPGNLQSTSACPFLSFLPDKMQVRRSRRRINACGQHQTETLHLCGGIVPNLAYLSLIEKVEIRTTTFASAQHMTRPAGPHNFTGCSLKSSTACSTHNLFSNGKTCSMCLPGRIVIWCQHPTCVRMSPFGDSIRSAVTCATRSKSPSMVMKMVEVPLSTSNEHMRNGVTLHHATVSQPPRAANQAWLRDSIDASIDTTQGSASPAQPL